jgi:hypothetical protein
MHPRITESLAFLDTNRAALLEAIRSAPEHARGTRPAPDRWSVAEVVSHLAAVEGRIGLFLASKIEEARNAGLGQETDDSAIEPTIDIPRLIDRERKLTASDAVQPRVDADVDDAVAKLAAHRDRLKKVIVAADGLALGEIVAPHPVLGSINAYQWIFFLGGHEARHTGQILEIVKLLAQRN